MITRRIKINCLLPMAIYVIRYMFYSFNYPWSSYWKGGGRLIAVSILHALCKFLSEEITNVDWYTAQYILSNTNIYPLIQDMFWECNFHYIYRCVNLFLIFSIKVKIQRNIVIVKKYMCGSFFTKKCQIKQNNQIWAILRLLDSPHWRTCDTTIHQRWN